MTYSHPAIRHVVRIIASVAVAFALLGLAVDTAEAKPDYGHVSGSGNPGRVVAAVENSPHCGGGPRFVLRNNTREPAAKQDSGPLGTFTVCVTDEAFADYPVGAWFNNESGTAGAVG